MTKVGWIFPKTCVQGNAWKEQLEKEARFRHLMAHNSHDSAIDTDSLEWETETVEFERSTVRNRGITAVTNLQNEFNTSPSLIWRTGRHGYERSGFWYCWGSERPVSTRGLWDIREQGGQRKYCGGQVKVGGLCFQCLLWNGRVWL